MPTKSKPRTTPPSGKEINANTRAEVQESLHNLRVSLDSGKLNKAVERHHRAMIVSLLRTYGHLGVR